MKKFLYLAAGLAMVIAFSCKKNMDVQKPLVPGAPGALNILTGEVTANTTITSDTYLQGLVYVKPGVTLTINAGVTMYCSKGTGAFNPLNPTLAKGTLCVEAGAKLIANGTCDNAIVWTSDSSIPCGQRKVGDWGGVVLYGKAPIHKANGATNGRYEAFDIVPTDTRNFYGGTDAADNSGSITYNRFEFGGGVVTEVNKEVNGLTLCGVGTGTALHHIEVLKSGDDAFEFFGGTVNGNHLLAFATKDDDYDFDEGYVGGLQYIVAIRDSSCDNSGSRMIEADNDASASSNVPYTRPFIVNATLVGPSAADAANHYFGTTTSGNYFDGAIRARRRVSLFLVNSYIIANKMPQGIIYSPTTGISTSPLVSVAALPSALPYNVQYNNTLQINDDPGFNGAIVLTGNENDPSRDAALVALLPFSANNATLVNAFIDPANLNAGLVSQADFNLDDCFANKTPAPAGINVSAFGAFDSSPEKGGVPSYDSWLCACFNGRITCADPNNKKLISIVKN